ncbi:MAG: hypothetical protein CVT89_06100 [Candidatus Altiarchaeales archaeon HGW-Altiarchaeales-2]|nr:MAG: hypothetical protein CVT89_06100 [Candidatus Altiarchaeales archaeon HGW-Altiarchaeales-2]
MSNKYIVPIGVLIAGIFIIAGSYMILNPQNPSQTSGNNTKNTEFTESSSAEAHLPKITVSAGELQKNADISFEVGKKYKYKETSQEPTQTMVCRTPGGGESVMIMSGRVVNENETNTSTVPPGCVVKNEIKTLNTVIEYTIEKIERDDGQDCFVISQKNEMEISEEQKENMTQDEMMTQEMMQGHTIYYYYDKRTGKLVQVKQSSLDGSSITTITGSMAEIFASEKSLFSEWMLALKDDFIWEQKINTSSDIFEERNSITYVVKGREKVANRDCFNVEITETMEGEGEDIMTKDIKTFERKTTRTMWIDVNARIIVKEIEKSGNLITSTFELVDES